jgi:hypothetical protein
VAAKKTSDEGNASDFIRAQASTMTAPEVVEAGKKAGFEFSASLVYAVRGRMKKPTSSAPSKREPKSRRAASASGGTRLDSQIQGLVNGFVREMSELVRRAALDAVRQALGERSR